CPLLPRRASKSITKGFTSASLHRPNIGNVYTVLPSCDAPGFLAALDDTNTRNRLIEQYSSGRKPSCDGYAFLSSTPCTFCRSVVSAVFARQINASLVGPVENLSMASMLSS